MNELMPAIFFGHGNPLNALAHNAYTDSWSAIGSALPRPKAILSVSAHWYIPACAVTATPSPRTIHDFGGFPHQLYEVQYPAPGSLELALRVKELLSHIPVALDNEWGLDHGTWSVLTHVFPHADIPVVQLGIDSRQPPQFHYETGKQLAMLREEGVLVIGSGNLVHNLHAYAWGEHETAAYDWAVRFENSIKELLQKNDHARIVGYEQLGRDAMLSVPTPDHYLPLLYILGLRREQDIISYPVQGVDGGSISMLAVQIG